MSDESKTPWLLAILIAVGTGLAGIWVKLSKARHIRARTRDVDADRWEKLIVRMEHEIDRLVKEVSCLQAENAAQAEQMKRLDAAHKECDEKYRAMEAKVEALEARR